jgi:macrodomain Ter protein organizer (MatP/YcbG family)
MNSNNNPFDDVKLKRMLKVTLQGYGERRNKVTNVHINGTTYKKAIKKCKWIGCTFNEAINQLLFIWSKDEADDGTIKPPDKNITFSNSKELDKRVGVSLEATIYRKTMNKCNRTGCRISETVNNILAIWTETEEETNNVNVNINESANQKN